MKTRTTIPIAGRLLPLLLLLAGAGCHDFATINAGTDGAPAMMPVDRFPDVTDGGPARVLPWSCNVTVPPMCGGDSCCDPGDVVPAQSSFSRGYDKSEQNMQDGERIVGWQSADGARAGIDSFVLDKYEVTVGRFRRFFEEYDSVLSTAAMDRAGARPGDPTSGWSREWNNANNANPGSLYATDQAGLRAALDVCNRTHAVKITSWLDDTARADDSRPVSCVTWYEAFLFCIADGGRLPTEAEWNVAAAGGEQYRAYPWNAAADAASLTVTAADGYFGPAGSFPPKTVGSYPERGARWKHLDLAGNVYELVRDRADSTLPATYTAAGSNPVQLVGGYAVVRGGSYVFHPAAARSANRRAIVDNDPPARRFADVGWRCARQP
jgi:sulfatase modifying factor 1